MKSEFKISVVSELESGKPQIATEHGIHSSIPCRWQDELAENPERANSFNGDRCKYKARIAQALEVGRASSCRE
jgi:transposase